MDLGRDEVPTRPCTRRFILGREFSPKRLIPNSDPKLDDLSPKFSTNDPNPQPLNSNPQPLNPSTQPLIQVEADASAATYPLAIAAITGGKVTCDAVGTGSTQGDAKFCFLLEKMGCTVTQDESKTTVQGPPPGTLKGLGTFDMESMTDAFMTAAVLAAVAHGKTTITGVANQRVKECNRIEVMRTELTKCGVTISETEDGLEIVGAGGVANLKGAVIHCHDDHRIAMSFACLGCLLPGLIITEKECVEKTYPEYWDHMRSCLGATLQVCMLPTIFLRGLIFLGTGTISGCAPAIRPLLEEFWPVRPRGCRRRFRHVSAFAP